MRAFNDIDRSYPARKRRTEEFRELAALPYRDKEQEGRYVWLKKQKKIDAVTAWRREYKEAQGGIGVVFTEGIK